MLLLFPDNESYLERLAELGCPSTASFNLLADTIGASNLG